MSRKFRTIEGGGDSSAGGGGGGGKKEEFPARKNLPFYSIEETRIPSKEEVISEVKKAAARAGFLPESLRLVEEVFGGKDHAVVSMTFEVLPEKLSGRYSKVIFRYDIKGAWTEYDPDLYDPNMDRDYPDIAESQKGLGKGVIRLAVQSTAISGIYTLKYSSLGAQIVALAELREGDWQYINQISEV